MIEMMSVILACAIMMLVSLLWIDRHIHALIDAAFEERCAECKHRVSETSTETEHAV